MKAMMIGEIARLSGTGAETIRYYERVGVLPVPERRPSGYRRYDASTLARLTYIRQAKDLGFTLAEIRELLDLASAPSDCGRIRRRAEGKIRAIEGKIRSLQRMRRSLRKILEQCRGEDSADACPLQHRTGKQPTT